MIRIVLADDHNLVRAGVRALLESLPGVEVVGEAADGRQAVALIGEKRPDIALIDISMPGLNGLGAAEQIAASCPSTRIVILSMHANESYVAQALKLGVSGYVLKEACIDELPVLLRAVTSGQTYLSPGISRQVVEALHARTTGHEAPPSPADVLTPRQREILQLIAEGKSTKDIAHTLTLSVKTVETHRAQIMERLAIRDVAGLVKYAIRVGLASGD